MISLDYHLELSGWAAVKISHGGVEEEIYFSYLHDSLKDLAKSALEIEKKKTKVVIFLLEPGEQQLILSINDYKIINYQLILYKDWSSFNTTRDDGLLLMEGECSVINYKNEVRNILIKIMSDYGPDRYKDIWALAKFPLEEYNQLI